MHAASNLKNGDFSSHFSAKTPEFFRDPEAWKALAERVLSSLLDEPESDQPLRFWVPGCATGEEAYSIAMLLTEEIEKRKLTRSFMILASDVNRIALARAR